LIASFSKGTKVPPEIWNKCQTNSLLMTLKGLLCLTNQLIDIQNKTYLNADMYRKVLGRWQLRQRR